jgi:hypothetical protein
MSKIELLKEKKDDLKKMEIRDERGHFTMVNDAFIDSYARVVGIYAFGVYVVMCRHANVSRDCWPSEGYLAAKLGISTRQIKRGIALLEDYKLINVNRVRGCHNVYQLLDKAKWKKVSYLKSSAPACLLSLEG